MKKIFLLFLVNISVAIVYSQQRNPQQIIKIDPLALVAATFSMDYERVLSQQMSTQIGAAYTMQQVELWDGLGGRLSGYHVEGQVRRYFIPGVETTKLVAPEGVYVGIWGKYETLNASIKVGGDQADVLNGGAFSGGLIGGCQFWMRYKKRPFALMDVFMGGGYKVADYSGRFSESGKLVNYARAGIIPRFGLSLGLPLFN